MIIQNTVYTEYRLTPGSYYQKFLDNFIEWKFGSKFRFRTLKHHIFLLDDFNAAG